jgi:hypothetical protein
MVKKFWLAFLVIGFMISGSSFKVWAEEGAQKLGSLNVVSKNGTCEVQLDEDTIGFTPLKLYRIQAGSHHFKALSFGEVVQEEVIQVNEGEVTTIMIPSEVVEEKVEQTEDIKQDIAPKTFSVGYDISWPFYGLSFIYHPGSHGVGLNYYQGQSSYGYNRTHYSLRYYYYLQPGMYISAGFGQYSDNRSDYTYYYTEDGFYDGYEYKTTNYVETLWGIHFGAKTSDYTKYEFGYGISTSNTGVTNASVALGMGIMFDF